MHVPTVSVTEAQRLHAEGTPLFDVREEMEWAQSHIPGAVLTPMSQFMDFLHLIKKDTPSLIYCQSGNRSGQVAAWLNQQGYDASNVAGGILDWAASGLPLEP